MFDLDNDIIETFHCVDDGSCPVTDQLKEELYANLSPMEKKHTDYRNTVQDAAIDTYWKILDEGGNVTDAQKAFFEVQKKFYEHN